jgi:glycosyltransferase involved in cell wall biosynthesis
LFSEAIEKFVHEQKIDRVEFYRDIDDQKLAELYAAAKLYVFPSRLEGFGLPALEAMSMGVPVIAARAGSLPEILGEAAEYFDPNSPAELAEAIETLWLDENKRNKMVARGREQIKKYSWTTMAKKNKTVYQNALRP